MYSRSIESVRWEEIHGSIYYEDWIDKFGCMSLRSVVVKDAYRRLLLVTPYACVSPNSITPTSSKLQLDGEVSGKLA